jgi:hypothetical protein
MHPLAVEDLLNKSGHALSKADYYPKHLFIRVLCHTLDCAGHSSQGSEPIVAPSLTNLPRSASPQRLDKKLTMEYEGTYEKCYGHEFDPMADEFEHARVATLADPEMGGRSASLIVS